MPAVKRSVMIASISTRELVTKDFAMEGDEEKMPASAHQMAQNLAGILALVTCKEPLRISMIANARILLLANGFTEQNLPEQAIMVIMQENLDLERLNVTMPSLWKPSTSSLHRLHIPSGFSQHGHRPIALEVITDGQPGEFATAT
ncbi:hypothetical protein NDA11_005880 [Ustilago hordei]|uniref:uncharacterized protein n=1 Tax=Ustilago hordei TaxID=120017 RepID=UPI001A47CF77|nr:uncharacterized protein UHO2_03887 [Ustilago hordei]KAJ1037434.1 hypothetical protein NDA10_000078 [Ustilago hordei]KAJ1579860.1 hypothetical protein NDA15_000945 [Ustilago hordei]KAJ1581722.1 hypothetical protein NDA12_000873 [Ustilago hordei]KAJ1582536.1 hypothetical protein NDA11_005880 [Ustilago hordei]KAJ1600363.1 hypothetical protein NDA14_007116 [Ustilago hordei]